MTKYIALRFIFLFFDSFPFLMFAAFIFCFYTSYFHSCSLRVSLVLFLLLTSAPPHCHRMCAIYVKWYFSLKSGIDSDRGTKAMTSDNIKNWNGTKTYRTDNEHAFWVWWWEIEMNFSLFNFENKSLNVGNENINENGKGECDD